MPRQPGKPLPTQPPGPSRRAGRTMADVLALPDIARHLIRWMLRQHSVAFHEVVAHVGEDAQAVRSLLETLEDQGFIAWRDVEGVLYYQVCLASQRQRPASAQLWQTLSEKLPLPKTET